jgi:hypothetical protein
MASVSLAMQAKSDQLNYVDIGSSEIVIFITGVDVKNSDQPVSIHYYGSEGRPYKPCKSMIRVLSEAWGDEADNWVGKSVKLYGDPTVKWAGKEVGGLRIRALSNINKNGVDVFVTLNRATRRKTHFDYLETLITEADQKWIDAINRNPSVADQIENPAYRAKIENIMKGS